MQNTVECMLADWARPLKDGVPKLCAMLELQSPHRGELLNQNIPFPANTVHDMIDQQAHFTRLRLRLKPKAIVMSWWALSLGMGMNLCSAPIPPKESKVVDDRNSVSICATHPIA